MEQQEPTPMALDLPQIRGYQEDILRRALEENVIAFLPTGAGKTLIAARLIREKLEETDPTKNNEERKWSVFLTPTVILVHQQADAIKREVPDDCGVKGFYGDIGVDLWNKAKWDEETAQIQILVMTPQIFLNMLLHSYWSLAKCNLLILDEIHQATKDAPYARIFKDFYHKDEYPIKPHIFGMTASPVYNVKDNEFDIREAIEQLQQLTDCRLVTAHDRSDLDKYVARPDERILYYDNSEFAQQISVLCESVMPEKGEKTLHAAMDVASTLGLVAAHRYISSKRFKKESFAEQEKLKKLMFIAHEHGIRGDFPISYKFNHLCNEIRDLHVRHGGEFCGIIFVERRATCRMLCDLLKAVDLPSEIHVGFFHGQGNTKYTVEERPSVKDIQEKFKTKQINLLIATKAVEEGVDVQACKFVVQFDRMMATKSYIQSRGRARKLESDFVIFVETADMNYQKRIAQHQKYTIRLEHVTQASILNFYLNSAELIMIGQTARETDDSMELDSPDFSDDELPYMVAATGAQANLLSSVQLVNQYAQTVPGDGFTSNKLEWREIDLNGGCFQMTVETPDNLAATGQVCGSRKKAKRSAALAMVKLLHERHALNDNLLPNIEKEQKFEENIKEIEENLTVLEQIPKQFQTPLTLGHLYVISEISDFEGRAIFGLIFPEVLKDVPEEFKFGEKLFKINYQGPYHGDLEPIKIFNLKLCKYLFSGHLKTLKSEDFPTQWQNGAKNILIIPCSIEEDELFIDHKIMAEFVNDPGAGPEENLLEVLRRPNMDMRNLSGFRIRTNHTKDEQQFIIQKFSKDSITKVYDRGTEKFVFDYFTEKYHLKLDPTQIVVFGRKVSASSFEATENIHKRFWVEDCPSHLYHLPVELCSIFFQKFDWLLQYRFIPLFIHQIERHIREVNFFREFTAKFADSKLADPQSFALLRQSIIPPVLQEELDYERLEILGDCVIKLLVATGLFYKHKHAHEGQLTTLLGNRVSNKALREALVATGLHLYIQNAPFQNKSKPPNSRWTIPGLDTEPVLRKFSAKMIADCTEALIGASYIVEQPEISPYKESDAMDTTDANERLYTELSDREENSLRSALNMMIKFKVADDVSSSIERILAGNLPVIDEKDLLALNENQLGLVRRLEHDLGYIFKQKRYALAGITHPSYRVDYSGSYQRLEFLGDAVLDFFTLRYLYFKNQSAKPGELTEYKHASVNNQAFSYICVKNKLHKHLRFVNPDLARAIREFEEECDKCQTVHEIHRPAPKALGDILEAIAGAIYVDSNYRYEPVWNVFKRFLVPFWTTEITANNRGTPIGHLYNWISQYTKSTGCTKIRLIAEESVKNKPAKCVLSIHGKEVLVAEGRSKRAAKWLVGKKAMAMSRDLANPFNSFCTCKKDTPEAAHMDLDA